MNRQELIRIIRKKKSFLCVGLDSDISKLPPHLMKEDDPIFEFNKRIIDATIDYAVAYKPNLAFYESAGLKGWISLEKTISYLHNLQEKVFIIADAKRGDIGNTSNQYARAFFEVLNVDALTVAPYMGSDSVQPFLAHHGKWTILLGLTSNKGANDFQYLQSDEMYLFEHVLLRSSQWGSIDNLMYVVGATQAEQLGKIREIIPDHFLLVPGVGAQGGSLQEVARYGMNKDVGLLVNASRSIIFASHEEDFGEKAKEEAMKVQSQMADLM